MNVSFKWFCSEFETDDKEKALDVARKTNGKARVKFGIKIGDKTAISFSFTIKGDQDY